MANNKLLSDVEIKEILENKANEIKEKVIKITKEAANEFYAASSSSLSPENVSNIDFLEKSGISVYTGYERTYGFLYLGENPQEKLKGNTLTLTFIYKASDLSVNEWNSPWGVYYPGSPEWAFDTGFVHGLHGGPRPTRKGKWTWNGVPKSMPIWDIIKEKITTL